jgi:hypothetical protein
MEILRSGLNSGKKMNNNEIDYRDDIKRIDVVNGVLKVENEDLPLTIILEGRKKYELKACPEGLLLNKKE